MSESVALKPALYAREGTTAAPAQPSLKGGRCSCGHVFFPYQTYGCEICGRHGEALSPLALSGRGKLLASAKVHLHAAKDRPVPFTIGSIALDDGPRIRTLMGDADARALTPGTTMLAALTKVGTDESGRDIVDLRFTAAP